MNQKPNVVVCALRKELRAPASVGQRYGHQVFVAFAANGPVVTVSSYVNSDLMWEIEEPREDARRRYRALRKAGLEVAD